MGSVLVRVNGSVTVARIWTLGQTEKQPDWYTSTLAFVFTGTRPVYFPKALPHLKGTFTSPTPV